MISPSPQSIMAYSPIWNSRSERYNIYAYDMPGHDNSPMYDYSSFKFQGIYLFNFLKHFELKDVHIIGPDIAMPAVIYLSGINDSNIKSIMIGEGPGIAPSKNASLVNKMIKSKFWRSIFRTMSTGAMVQTGIDLGYINYVPNNEEVLDYKKSYQKSIPDTMKWFKNFQKNLAIVDPLIDRINVPTQVFWGRNDALLNVDNGERLQKRIKNSEIKIFENCGHYAFQDKYLEFQYMIISYY